MARQDYVIGIDCSTTATKAVVWGERGRAVAEGRETFGLSSPQPDWGEQNAEDWWASTKTALRRAAQVVDARRIGAIGITHQRVTFVCVSEADHPVRPAILWLDSRAKEEVARYGSEETHRITGKKPNPTVGLYKMLWLRDHEPDTMGRTVKVADVHAFLVHRMTGRWRTSWASADPLGLVDMESFDYSDELLGMVGLDREHMCDLSAPGEVIGELTEAAAREVGLPAGLPIVGGVGDGQAAGLGANITEPGRAYLNLGTGVVSGMYSEDYSYGDDYRVLSGPIPKTYTFETLLPAGTYMVSWFCERFAGVNAKEFGLDLSTEQILETAAARVGPGSGGLFAVPYWNNALMPYWDFDARGIMVGWTGAHGKAHAYRAILEGIAFEQRLMTEGAEGALEKPVEHILAMGGGSRSPLWCQIIADVMQRPVSVTREPESTCLGAGMLAAAACGMHGGIREAAAAMSGTGDSFEPDEGRAARYDKLYGVYKGIYPSLRPLFPKLTDALNEGLDAARTEGETSMKHRHLRERVVGAARRMSTSGFVTGTSGNVSARTPEGDVLITPSGLDYGGLEPHEVVLVTVEGEVVEGSFEPSSETAMHTGIYRARPEVAAVVHTHARFATTLACLGWPIPPVHYMLTTLSEDGTVPLAPYATYGTDELAGHAGEALGRSHKACLLRNHGTIAVGESPEEAFSRTVVLEEMAEIYYRARVAGEPILLTNEQVAETAAKIAGYGQARPVSSEG